MPQAHEYLGSPFCLAVLQTPFVVSTLLSSTWGLCQVRLLSKMQLPCFLRKVWKRSAGSTVTSMWGAEELTA